MHQTVEAVVGQQGQIKILENLKLPKGRRVLVTLLDEVVLPYHKKPNAETRKAVLEARSGVGLKRYKNTKDLWDELDVELRHKKA